jgi:hypothetical protein
LTKAIAIGASGASCDALIIGACNGAFAVAGDNASRMAARPAIGAVLAMRLDANPRLRTTFFMGRLSQATVTPPCWPNVSIGRYHSVTVTERREGNTSDRPHAGPERHIVPNQIGRHIDVWACWSIVDAYCKESAVRRSL